MCKKFDPLPGYWVIQGVKDPVSENLITVHPAYEGHPVYLVNSLAVSTEAMIVVWV